MILYDLEENETRPAQRSQTILQAYKVQNASSEDCGLGEEVVMSGTGVRVPFVVTRFEL